MKFFEKETVVNSIIPIIENYLNSRVLELYLSSKRSYVKSFDMHIEEHTVVIDEQPKTMDVLNLNRITNFLEKATKILSANEDLFNIDPDQILYIENNRGSINGENAFSIKDLNKLMNVLLK